MHFRRLTNSVSASTSPDSFPSPPHLPLTNPAMSRAEPVKGMTCGRNRFGMCASCLPLPWLRRNKPTVTECSCFLIREAQAAKPHAKITPCYRQMHCSPALSGGAQVPTLPQKAFLLTRTLLTLRTRGETIFLIILLCI